MKDPKDIKLKNWQLQRALTVRLKDMKLITID